MLHNPFLVQPIGNSQVASPAVNAPLNIFQCLTLAEQLDVLSRGHNYDIGEKIQAFSDEVYLKGGGRITFPAGDYSKKRELWLKQNVEWVGEAPGFREPYTYPYTAPSGTCFYQLPNSNTNGVRVQCDLSLVGGVLCDTGRNTRNTGARHGGRLTDITLYGNRSLNPTPTAKDLNTSGNGLVTVGARNFVLENIVSLMWAENGWTAGSYTFPGGTALGINGLSAFFITLLGNYQDGCNLTIGDSTVTYLNSGYNGRNGVTAGLGNSQIATGRSWNNYGDGASWSIAMPTSSIAQVSSFFCYDNDRRGHVLDTSPRVPQLFGCVSRGNGRNSRGTYSADTDKVNFYVSAQTRFWSLVGCLAGGVDQGGVTTATYNYYINNTSWTGVFLGNSSDDAFLVADTYIADLAKLNVPKHGDPIRVGAPWTTYTTLPSNTLTVGNASLISLNGAGALTLDTITYPGAGLPEITIRNISASAVTITHNTSKIRCNGDTNITLAINHAVKFQAITSSVWQQV